MFIKELKIVNFRNYTNETIKFSNGFNIIHGDNAQGKTNIIEAVFLCSSGRSHRTSKDHDMVRMGENGFYIKLDMEKETESKTIEVFCEREGKKKIRINEIPIKKIGSLIGNLYTVIFSPEDLLIIKEGPSERRRFIDITISQVKPSYFYDLQQYNKVLIQRNHLLKEIQENRSLINTLDVWNQSLIQAGSRIIKVRQDFIARLSEEAQLCHYKLTDGKEGINVLYEPSFEIGINEDISSIEEKYGEYLKKTVNREIGSGITLAGPHRDDYNILVDGMKVKTYGSQGQQRTAILSIKLAEINIMKEITGEYPVLLLDDVMSELDEKRQEYLVRNLTGIQTYITTADSNYIRKYNMDGSSFIKVESGKIASAQINLHK